MNKKSLIYNKEKQKIQLYDDAKPDLVLHNPKFNTGIIFGFIAYAL